MRRTVQLDASNRIALSRELQRAAQFRPRQQLTVIATPGRIVFEVAPKTTGEVVRRGKLKVWTGVVPETPIEEVVERSRHR